MRYFRFVSPVSFQTLLLLVTALSQIQPNLAEGLRESGILDGEVFVVKIRLSNIYKTNYAFLTH